MNLLRILPVLLGLVAVADATETIVLPVVPGVALTLAGGEDGWRAVRLQVPDGPEDGWEVADRALEVRTTRGEDAVEGGWQVAEAGDERVVLERAAERAGVDVRRVFLRGPSNNSLRMETWVRARGAETVLETIELLNWKLPGESVRELGEGPASFPLFGRTLFAGIEHVSGEAWTGGESFRLLQRPRLALTDAWTRVANVALGWPLEAHGRGLPEGARMREAFLHYLDAVRIVPDRMVLHSETWWTMMPPLIEAKVLEDIATLRRDFYGRTGMFFDTYCLDLGWSDPRTLWGIAAGQFPNGFRAVGERLGELGAKLGMWFSPGSGYPDGLDNAWLKAQGYEMTPFGAGLEAVPCMALGTRYQREFREKIVGYAREYALGHVILDFMAQRCDEPSHGHPTGVESRYAIDAGVADVLDGLRAVNPGIALEPMVCGYPPSPWWLTKTPFILGPAGDDIPYGRVPSPEWMEALITARDVAYRAGQEAWLMPTQALETWDLIVQTPGEFENTAVMAIGRGRWFLSSYLKPSLMKPNDWDFLAALVRWARANRADLGNAWNIGGRPEAREAYGFMFRPGERDLFCLRNPWIEERTIVLPASVAATGARELRMLYPRRMTLARIEPGETPPPVRLGPYETVFLETVLAGETTRVTPRPAAPAATVATAGSSFAVVPSSRDRGTSVGGPIYTWVANVTVPAELRGAELCVLVEGEPDVERVTATIAIDGQLAKVQTAKSAGQFGAAVTASPDNWVWFQTPLARGMSSVRVEVKPAGSATIGVFLRGNVAAANEAAPEAGEVFPVFRANEKVWSQTLAPLRKFEVSAP